MTDREQTRRDAETKLCGVDLPPQQEGTYCGCQRRAGHEGPHRFKNLSWPAGTNDPGLISSAKGLFR